MFGSLKLGKLFGIDLFVHGTFWLLPLFVFLSGAWSGDVSGAVMDVAVLLALFGCVALHEVGHAVAAAYYGIGTRDITLYPVGGVARLERMTEKPWQEVVIALAGPAVNLVIALGLIGLILLGVIAVPATPTLAGLDALDEFAWRLLIANGFLLVFNLIPAFPMDGGRVLRALLSVGMPRLKATRVAVAVGAVLAVGFVLAGLGMFQDSPLPIPPSFGLVLVGGVVFLLGQAELAQVRMAEAHREWKRHFSEVYDLGPAEELAPLEPFTGWKWDPVRRVWSQYHNGALVREVGGL